MDTLSEIDTKAKTTKYRFIKDLIAQMSLSEKIGQMVQVDSNWKGNIENAICQGRIGSLLTIKDSELIRKYQELARSNSRLKIPLLVGNDILHGYKQTFPIPLALSCTWNPKLITDLAEGSAAEASDNGTNWIFAPMLDVARDPRWGRIAETFGEDTMLGSQLARAWVSGFQTHHIAACAKHFAGYGAVEGGRDYNTVDLSERKLREVYFPPFKAALDRGVKTFMTSFTDVNGVPATINPFLIKKILRGEWGFEGVLVSDYDSIGELIHHGVAFDLKHAAKLSALAGIDIDMMSDAYYLYLEDLVNEGEVPLSIINEAVTRILKLKFDLGLFDEAKPLPLDITGSFNKTRNDDLILQAAEESIVLLKNEKNTLPITPHTKKIGLIGPYAKNQTDLLGSWNFDGKSDEVFSLFDSLKETIPQGSEINYCEGVDIYGKQDDIDMAIEVAEKSDLVILAVGEPANYSGEAHSRTHLQLPGKQTLLCEKIIALGKPVILIIFSGRPLCLGEMYRQSSAVLYAWQGGLMAGKAMARVLYGFFNPSGKLAVSIPRSEGQIPVYYSQKSTGRPSYLEGTLQFNQAHKSIYLDESNEPEFPFGFGLSYSQFKIVRFEIEKSPITLAQSLHAVVDLKNEGPMAGSETIQLYLKKHVASYCQPVKKLIEFKKVFLNPGEEQSFHFSIPAHRFATLDEHFNPVVEPGAYTIWAGTDVSSNISKEFCLRMA